MPNAKRLWEDYQERQSARTLCPQRKFTGRADFRLAYFNLMERAIREKFENYYIIDFYGVPGIGKSSLLRRLETELTGDDVLPEDGVRERCLAAKQTIREHCGQKGPVVLRVDFDDPGINSVQDVLFAFRTQLVRQTDAVFPLFDLAMDMLYQKQGRYLKNVEKEKKSLTDDPVLGFLWDTISDATPAGTIFDAAKALMGLGEKVQTLLRDRKEAFRATYEEIRALDAPELIRRLPLYFAMDVNAAELPLICVFLDTYEMAYSRTEGAGYQAGLDESWLVGPYGLIRQLGNAVFAIAGREKLGVEGDDWKPICLGDDSDDKRALLRELPSLSPEDTRELLENYGVGIELSQKLYELTEGDPVFLELCLDQYDAMLAAGKEPIRAEDFGGSRERMVERHTRYLPGHLREPLAVLAALERWDDQSYEELQKNLPFPLPVMGSGDYIRLTGLSYVRAEKGEWAMHSTIASALSSMLPSGMRAALIKTLARLGESSCKAFDMVSAARWYTYAAAQLDMIPDCLPPQGACAVWEQWAELCEETNRAEEWVTAREKALACCQKQDDGKMAENTAHAACELGRAYFKQGRYEDALPLLQESAQAYAGALGGNAPLTFYAAGLYHAVCEELGKADDNPLTKDIGWDYRWTGRESPKELEILCKWWRLRIEYSEYNYYEENREFLRELAAKLKAAPESVRDTSAALWAEMQMTQQYVEQRIDSTLVSQYGVESVTIGSSLTGEDYEAWKRKWEQTPMLREPEVVLQTCAELVEHHKRVLAPDDPQIADALNTLAFAQEHQCLYHLAAISRQEALGLLRKAYGGDDADAQKEEVWLIEDYRKAGRFADAIRQQQTRMDRLRGDENEPIPAELQERWTKELKTMEALRKMVDGISRETEKNDGWRGQL